MKYLFSLYSLKFVKSLVYLMQKCEYFVMDFLGVLRHVSDFRKVEIRGKLVFTIKANIIYIILELSRIILFCFALYNIFYLKLYFNIIFLVLIPVLIIIELIIISLLVNFLQKPLEYYLIYKAKRKLKNIKAIKIGIVGSFGKTSMREILFSVLDGGKKVATVSENHNTPLGIAKFIMNLKGDEDILIFEFGEYYKGDIKYLCNFIKPDMGIITGINEAHMERFKSIKNIISTIFEISDYLKDKNVYVNTDNQLVDLNKRKVNIPFNVNGIENFLTSNIKSDLNGTSFSLDENNKIVNYKTILIGKHNVSYITLSIFLAKKFGLSDNEMMKGVENIKPIKHRLELKKINNNLSFLDDSYNGNIDGFMVALDFLKGIKDKRILYVTPGLVESGSAKVELHEKIGNSIAESNIKNVILIKNSVTPVIVKALNNAGYDGEIMFFDTMLDLLKNLQYFTLENDLLVIQNDWGDHHF
ncbi:MAG: UDP-N-acetylmuramoyl-tripeptide--D-alanyl-D-alanine ligase [Candidatus Nomurabacteria bacterium]